MNMRNVGAMMRKEVHHLIRDKRSLALMFLMPLIMLFLYGYAIRLDILAAPIGVLQESSDAASNDLAAQFAGSPAFHIAERYRDRKALAASLQQGRVWAAIVIPDDYARDLARGSAKIQLILDGTDANTARLVRNYALALVNRYALSLSGVAPYIEIDSRTWFNEANESRYAIVPGVIVLVMSVVGALMTALTIAREMELGNLVMLRTTTLSRMEFLVGKLAPYFVIGMVDVLAAIAVAVFIFGIPLQGSLASIVAASALFLLVVMCQGALISVSAGNQMLASQLVQVTTFLPSFLLSGAIYAIGNMPLWLQYATAVFPARYFVSLSKAIFLKGVSPFVLWPSVAALATVLTVLATLLYRRANRLGLEP
ncbi:MAG TPA: ABC transporter permease [Casimicrobiaceae bacterium]|nr:ABC transporter permease [Casimicrobiaceae bacterium]